MNDDKWGWIVGAISTVLGAIGIFWGTIRKTESDQESFRTKNESERIKNESEELKNRSERERTVIDQYRQWSEYQGNENKRLLDRIEALEKHTGDQRELIEVLFGRDRRCQKEVAALWARILQNEKTPGPVPESLQDDNGTDTAFQMNTLRQNSKLLDQTKEQSESRPLKNPGAPETLLPPPSSTEGRSHEGPPG